MNSYYQRHREEILAKRKVRYEAKKDQLRAYQREYIRAKRAKQKISESQEQTDDVAEAISTE